MNVGDRVKFIGPEYRFTNHPLIGQFGVITEMAGHRSQRVGEEPKELVTVKFDGDDKPTVLDLNRITDAPAAK